MECTQALSQSNKKDKDECDCTQPIQCIVKHSKEVFYACPASNNVEQVQYVIDSVQKPKTSWIAPST